MAETNFIDYVKIHCESGKGGDGSAHLHKAKCLPKGGPDGGDGGRGGHIILKADPHCRTLMHLKRHKYIKASPGEDGSAQKKCGRSGRDVVVKVPVGTTVKDDSTGEPLFELTVPGATRILCRGGMGGLGNDFFKSPTNRTPRYAQKGEDGQEGWFVLELKLLADVGLVGFPNAGKSTLLSSISGAKPKIAPYPFTTLEPNLGIVRYREGKSFVMADIPGIIKGAHSGKGIGLRFLRHIERNSVLLFLVSAENGDISSQFGILCGELYSYDPVLMHKRKVLAVTKCDLKDEKEMDKIRESLPENIPSVMISSVTGMGLEELKDKVWEALEG